MHMRAWITLAALLVAGATDAGEKPLERYDCIVMVTNAPASGMVRIRLTIDRWSTPEERKAYVEAIKSGGSSALASAMEKLDVGSIQVEQNLRYPIAYAIKAQTPKGELIRVATNRPIGFVESMRGFVSLDYPIGVVELVFPPGKPGTGFILGAASVKFDKDGQLEVKSHPRNTGPQRITQATREKGKDES
ncbi:MAG TPA: hypothetical protein VFB67_05655 [Candidatus Polarisedimenticolaceae bacterium]|nr:hypothetical protein [Candidatus Polarisedimenticolaceae bacterium]